MRIFRLKKTYDSPRRTISAGVEKTSKEWAEIFGYSSDVDMLAHFDRPSVNMDEWIEEVTNKPMVTDKMILGIINGLENNGLEDFIEVAERVRDIYECHLEMIRVKGDNIRRYPTFV